MTIITPYKRSYQCCTEWNDLTGKQLLQVMQTLESKRYDDLKRILKLFKIIAGLSWWQFFRLGERIEEFIYLVAFLFNSNTLTKQVLPRYYCNVSGHLFYGAADELNNLVMAEFVLSEDYYMRWVEAKEKTELLNELVAVLYRHPKQGYDFEKNADDDARIPFNQNICSYYAKHVISYWPMHVKIAIAHWYSACRQKLVDDNPDVFGGTGEPPKYGLLQVMYNVAEEAAFGNFSQVENQYMHLVMVSLNIAVQKAKAIEKNSKR